jgi:YVTN family beta-propeller protein
VSNDVSVIDVAALKVIKTIQVGELPWGITIAKQ